MAKRCFELRTTVPGAPVVVIDFLMDVEKHQGLHPYLVSATITGTGSSHLGPWWDWQVVERPKLGLLRYPIRFRTRLTRTSPTSVESRLQAMPGCHLRSITRAVATPEGSTLVTESVAAVAPFLLVGYMARQARYAHAATFALLPAALERESLADGA